MKYTVLVEDLAVYEVTVEADSSDSARALAEEMVADGNAGIAIDGSVKAHSAVRQCFQCGDPVYGRPGHRTACILCQYSV